MITSEEALEILKPSGQKLAEQIKKGLIGGIGYIYVPKEYANEIEAYNLIKNMIEKVKRYFELKENGIRSFEDTNEHLELLKQIKEMVGIKE